MNFEPNNQASDPRTTLQLDDVTFGYGPGDVVVDGVSGTVAAGRICALIGPNAAGKSTLLKLMLGQLEPSSGRITMQGESASCPIAAMPPRQRAAHISYVPQRPAAHLTFRVDDIIAMGRFAFVDDSATVEEAVDQAIATFDLSAIRQRSYGELSVGQQQRVTLARAWAQAFKTDPSHHVMLLDEPISAMDLKHVHHTMRAMGDLARQGYAIVMVLHDLNLTALYADDVWLLNEGRMVAAGLWQEVMQPSVLESVYDVPIESIAATGENSGQKRPVFHIANPATM